jgi:uncharacterized protein
MPQATLSEAAHRAQRNDVLELLAGPDAHVPCNGCTLCCRHCLVPLLPEYGDDPAAYEAERGPLDMMFLKRKPNGECVYLGETGCTIYERRPAVCRRYDCAGQWTKMTRAARRKMVAIGALDKAILDKGREIALARARAAGLRT